MGEAKTVPLIVGEASEVLLISQLHLPFYKAHVQFRA